MSKAQNKKSGATPTVAQNNRGRKAGSVTFVTVNIAKLASLVGEGNVEVRKNWLEKLIQSKAVADAMAGMIESPSDETPKIEVSISQ